MTAYRANPQDSYESSSGRLHFARGTMTLDESPPYQVAVFYSAIDMPEPRIRMIPAAAACTSYKDR